MDHEYQKAWQIFCACKTHMILIDMWYQISTQKIDLLTPANIVIS